MDKDFPSPPKPPEIRIQCLSCGFIAPESEFRKKHKRCWTGIAVLIAIVIALIGILGSVALKITELVLKIS